MTRADVVPAPRGPLGLDRRVLASLLAAAAALLLLPFDRTVGAAARGLDFPSDFEAELGMLQQYGQFSATLLASVVILLLHPAVRGRLWDWWLALGVSSLACHTLKMVLGRPRPKLADPYVFTLPWETYLRQRPEGDEVIRAFDFGGSALWSLPSSHTAAAMVMSVFLVRLYPPLRPFAIAMVVVVGLARVLFGKHWPSDVAVGALVGYLAADAVWRGAWGQRLRARLARSA